jgi:acetate kinase
MQPSNPRILTINGGSSSVKFALFETGASLHRILGGGIDRIGKPGATLLVKGLNPGDNISRPLTAPDLTTAVDALIDGIEEHNGRGAFAAVGHRVVHGGRNIASHDASRRKWLRTCASSVHSIRSICRRKFC